MRQATVRFYFDADILGLAKDHVWIPECSRQDWLIITRDSRIQSHRREVDAVRSFNARMVALASTEAKATWDQLEVFMTQWRSIERLLGKKGPFIYSATRSALKPIVL